MPKLYVIADRHMWMTPLEGLPGRFQHNTAFRGDLIDVTDAEAKRGLELGVLSKEAGDLVEASARSSEPRPWGNEQLAGANVDDIVAYVGQRPSEAERVLDAENARSRPRKGVLEAVERVIDARDAELERLAVLQEDEQLAREEEARARAGGAPAIPAAGR